ncbi:Uncharacterised protein [Bordetella pertussis]|nr:Uncharacterised protein [Bordetella pertussis]
MAAVVCKIGARRNNLRQIFGYAESLPTCPPGRCPTLTLLPRRTLSAPPNPLPNPCWTACFPWCGASLKTAKASRPSSKPRTSASCSTQSPTP